MPRSWGCWPGGMETTGIWLPYSRIWRAAKRKELSSQFCVTKRNQRGRMHTLQQLEVLIYKSYLITPSSPSLDKHLLRFHYVPAGAIQGLGISEWTRQTVPVLSWIFPFRLGWSRDGTLPALLPSAPHHRFASPFSFLSGYLCIYFSLCLIHCLTPAHLSGCSLNTLSSLGFDYLSFSSWHSTDRESERAPVTTLLAWVWLPNLSVP